MKKKSFRNNNKRTRKYTKKRTRKYTKKRKYSKRRKYILKGGAKLDTLNPQLLGLITGSLKQSDKNKLRLVNRNIRNALDSLDVTENVALIVVKDKNYPDFIKTASAKIRSSKKVVLAAVQKKGELLKYASPDLKNDRDVVLSAVNQNGLAIEFASPDLKNDKEIIETAISNNKAVFTLPEIRGNIMKDLNFYDYITELYFSA